MATIFGPSAVDVQAAIRAEQDQQDLAAAARVSPMFSVGRTIGGSFGQAFQNAVGVADPRLRQARGRDEVKRALQASGLEFGTQESFDFIRQQFLDRGLIEDALNVEQVAGQRALQQAQLEKAQEDAITARAQARQETRAAAPVRLVAADERAFAERDKAVADADLAQQKALGIDPQTRATKADQARARRAEARQIEAQKRAIAREKVADENQAQAKIAAEPSIELAGKAERGLTIAEPAFARLSDPTLDDELRAQLHLQLIIAMYKTVDPDSTVSGPETEAAARGSTSDTIKGFFALLDAGGGRLTDKQTVEMVRSIRDIADLRRKNVGVTKREWTKLLKSRGLGLLGPLLPIRQVEALAAQNRLPLQVPDRSGRPAGAGPSGVLESASRGLGAVGSAVTQGTGVRVLTDQNPGFTP